MINKRIASMALLSIAISFAVQTYAEEGVTDSVDASESDSDSGPIDATNTLPDAKPGECFAKVIVPAQYELRGSEIEIKPEQEQVELVEATFDTEEKDVEVQSAYTKLTAVPPTFRTEEEVVELEEARTEWVTSLEDNGIPASPALLVAAQTNGVEIDNAEPNQCFREYFVPAKFEQKEKQVKIKDEAEIIKITEAEFEEGSEDVVVKEAYSVKTLIPAVYETTEEKIEIEPAQAVWQKGSGLVERIDNTTGEIMCLVQIPAKYETITKQVLKSEEQVGEEEMPAETTAVTVKKLVADASQEKEMIDAEYTTVTTRSKVSDAGFSWRAAAEEGEGTYTGLQICLKEYPAVTQVVKKEVLDEPARVEEEKVPAEMKIIQVQKVATAPEVQRTTIEAVTKTVEKRVKTVDEKLEWRRILCKTNMTTEMNKKIQQALKDAGYYNGPVDGSIGRGTMNSVNAYQKDKDLPRGGLTIKVLEELGLM